MHGDFLPPEVPTAIMAVIYSIDGLSGSNLRGVQCYVGRNHCRVVELWNYTLQEINISHLGKRKIIFKMPFWGDMLVPWRVIKNKEDNNR